VLERIDLIPKRMEIPDGLLSFEKLCNSGLVILNIIDNSTACG
jgi:hypothetical protein